MASRYLVGIDLGTTHTVVAYAAVPSAKNPGKADRAIRLFDIAQLVGPGAVAERPLLPSVRYHGAPGELASADLTLPWAAPTADAPQPIVIGQWARQLGAQVPGRLVSSAKSWLSHAQVDRLAPILPWGGAPDVPKVSPVQASADTLAHVRAAWNAQFSQAPLEQQDIVLTLPASFDDSARALTLQAAHAAGLPTLRLLEEPQAAFYDWLARYRKDLTQSLQGSRLVLVCDVGGGTTDLSLIRIDHRPNGEVQLDRIGVGNHLMLGGDNMDLALAHTVEGRLGRGAAADSAPCPPPALRAPPLPAQNPPPPRTPDSANSAPLSASQMAQLMERCRSAKELLLASDAPAQTTVTLLGGGSRLVGASRSVTLTRDEVQTLVRDGFFPRVESDASVQANRGALVAFGLPYARDPAISRHIADFLRQHASTIRQTLGDAAASNASGAPPMPDTLLLNGGVFRAPALAQRLQDTLAAWRGAPLRLLHNDNPDVAVARGAVAYALAQRGHGPAIGAGSAHSYFLLLQGARSANANANANANAKAGAGIGATLQGICILPRLSQPGEEVRLSEHTFALRVGQPVQFHLFSASADAATPYTAGQQVALQGDAFVRLPPIVTALPTNTNGNISSSDNKSSSNTPHQTDIPVQLVASLTEVGTLALHCVSVADATQRWLLEFDLRQSTATETSSDDAGRADGSSAATDAGNARRIAQAVAQLDRVFGSNAQKVDPKEVRQLRTHLEQTLGAREQWPLAVLRPLFDALWSRARGRKRSAEHERVWLNLAGYCLRPGFGDALDPWRMQQLWALHATGVQFARDKAVCAQWWTLWRRVAGGLAASEQLRLLDDFACNLQSNSEGTADSDIHPVHGSEDDMLRLGAALERIPSSYKAEVGNWLLTRIEKSLAKTAKQDATNQTGAKNGTGKGNSTSSTDTAALNTRLWVLGRIGARQPLHGSSHEVVEPHDVQPWIEALLALDWRRLEAAAFATAQMVRMTNDRVRDLPVELREQVAQRLQAAHTPPGWAEMVRQPVQDDAATTSRIAGESLPPGLRLVG
ncbi:MAG: hsp70 family protein [Burkholderiales bacterium]|nr:hsp70 family protein [Burkholderiales bacterium]